VRRTNLDPLWRAGNPFARLSVGAELFSTVVAEQLEVQDALTFRRLVADRLGLAQQIEATSAGRSASVTGAVSRDFEFNRPQL